MLVGKRYVQPGIMQICVSQQHETISAYLSLFSEKYSR